MKTHHRQLVLAIVSTIFGSAGCATSDEAPGESATDTGSAATETGPDSSTDSRPSEAATDSGTYDTAPEAKADAAGGCPTVGSTDTRKCGRCGSQNRFCLPGNTWTDWSACSGELSSSATECSIGEKRDTECGKCGKQTDTCDVTTCTWNSGACLGEGECTADEVESTKASCSTPGEVRTRTCSAKCAWSSFSTCAAPKGWQPMATAAIPGRTMHTAVWTGSKMLVWGGYGSSPSYKNDGAAWDFASDTWTTLATSPLAGRRQHAAVWTGSKMIVWSGYDGSTQYKDGALYDPATNSWKTLATSPLSGRHNAAVVWSKAINQMIVWGGCTSSDCSAVTNDGATYDPATDTWTAIPAGPLAARTDMAFEIVGGELVIFGGRNSAGTALGDGGRFDPTTKVWTKYSDPGATLDARYDSSAVSDGTTLWVFGGRTSSSSSSAKGGAAYFQPGVGWSPIPDAGDTAFAPSGKRYDVAAFYGAGKLFVFSGIPSTASDTPYTGFVAWDQAKATWSTVDATGAPGARARATVVWTGKEAVVWGGANGHTCCTYYNNGAVYRP